MLCELEEGKPDKLGHKVEQILWFAKNYAIYRTKQGVYVQFSDNDREALEQRQRFTKICPELCELRYLTPHMRSVGSLFSRKDCDRSSLYDHNIAQAMMLVMEGDVETGRKIAQQALKMAVERVSNDNTIRYVCASLGGWALILILGVVVLRFWDFSHLWPYVVAGIAGATGAMLSIATRLQSFRLKPCNQSDMNYFVSVIRVGVGVIAGVILLLIAPTVLGERVQPLIPGWPSGWEAPAVLGLIAGFAERLIPNIMRWSSVQLEPSFGTPSQAVRAEEMRTSKQAEVRPDTKAHKVKTKGKSQASVAEPV
jgi:hypothetical protein